MSDLYLYIYDISKGMARQFSPMFLGKTIDGIWHTGIVAFGDEWYFGNDGINYCPPKGTILGEPNEIMHLGRTELNQEDFFEVIRQMSEKTYKLGSYNLLEHNCNNFSNDLSILLVGKPIPSHIIDLPREIMNTSIGPMLRPLLEQAADPISTNGEIKIPKYLINNQKPAATEQTLPSTAILFEPNISNELDILIKECENKLKINDTNLLIEIKEFLQQAEIKWSISKNHVKFLFDLYSTHLKEKNHLEIVLKVFQTISLNKPLAETTIQNELLVTQFLPSIKKSEIDLQINSLRMLSNICTHSPVSKALLEKHQDVFFKELSELILIEPSNDVELDMHEACISFFYNLVIAYDLDPHVSDTNALTLGCAVIERMPKLKLKPKSIYQILALLRSCLIISKDMKDLAVSMDFDLSKYKLNEKDKETIKLDSLSFKDNQSTSTSSNMESYEAILSKVDTILNQKE